MGKSPIAWICIALTLVVLICGTSWYLGHTARPERQEPTDENVAANTELVEMTFAGGITKEGDAVEHTFHLKNETTQNLTIKEKSDITLDCGCASLAPTKRELAPDESTEIHLVVKTAGRTGPLRKGGRIRWTRADGAGVIVSLALTADVKPKMFTDQDTVFFDQQDVTSGKVRLIELKQNFPLDWSTLQVNSTSANFQVAKVERQKNGANVYVKLQLDPDQESADGWLAASASATNDEAEVDKKATTRVHLQARQMVALTVAPQILFLHFTGKETMEASTRLLFQGEQAEQIESILDHVKFGNCQVTWQLVSKPDSKRAFVQLRLVSSRKDLQATSKSEKLVIHLKDRRDIQIACVLDKDE